MLISAYSAIVFQDKRGIIQGESNQNSIEDLKIQCYTIFIQKLKGELMSDYIIRATAANNQIRAYAATTRELCEHAHKIHETSPAVTVALGRLLTAGSLMGSLMKNDDEVLTLQIKSDGPIGGLTVTANSKADVKGFAFEPKAQSSDPLKTVEVIGNGNLSIIKDIGLKEPYVGTSPLITGEIAEDITYYYAFSEQIPTSVALGLTLKEETEVNQAGGFIIQLLPNTSDEIIDQLEKKLSQAPSVTTLLEKGQSPEEILQILLGDFGLNIIDKIPTAFKCDCSKDRVTKALIAVGEKGLKEMIEDGKTIEVNCDFCSKHYYFTPQELDILLHIATQKKMQKFKIMDLEKDSEN